MLLKLTFRRLLARRLLRLTLPAVLPLLLALPLAALMGATAVSHAQITPRLVTLTMTGPVKAISGQEISYRVHYHLKDPIAPTGFQLNIPRNTTYVSSEVVSGPPGVLLRVTEEFVEWGSLGSAEEIEGEVELTVNIDADFVGRIFASAGEPGPEAPFSDVLETQVVAPGTLSESTGGGAITGTASHLVDQTIVDGVVVDETLEPLSDGRIAIPELGIDMPLSPDGTFQLSDLASATPHTLIQVTVVFTAPGLGSFTFLHLLIYPEDLGPNLTPQLIDTPRVNDLNRAHFHGDSFPEGGHAGPPPSRLPEAGAGATAAGAGAPVAPALLALAGAALVCAGAAIPRQGCALAERPAIPTSGLRRSGDVP